MVTGSHDPKKILSLYLLVSIKTIKTICTKRVGIPLKTIFTTIMYLSHMLQVWNIYLHLRQFRVTLLKYTSTMEHLSITLWLFNIAMENGSFIDDFPMKISIYSGFSVAMLVIARW